MYCDWCGSKLKHPSHPTAAKYINPETLQPSPLGQRHVFCTFDHKEKFLNSLNDMCWICEKVIKADSPLTECVKIEGIDFYLCQIHKTPIWRDEVIKKANESIEEWIELEVISRKSSLKETPK